MMDEDDRRNRKGGPTFDPPVYKQRYNFVENIVRDFGAKKVNVSRILYDCYIKRMFKSSIYLPYLEAVTV